MAVVYYQFVSPSKQYSPKEEPEILIEVLELPGVTGEWGVSELECVRNVLYGSDWEPDDTTADEVTRNVLAWMACDVDNRPTMGSRTLRVSAAVAVYVVNRVHSNVIDEMKLESVLKVEIFQHGVAPHLPRGKNKGKKKK